MLRPVLLCVDSDLDDQAALVKACDGAFEVRCVDTGEAAAALLEGSNKPFAAVIVGPKLKDMCGVDFLDKATAVAPDTRRVLVAAGLDLKTIQHAINDDAICKLLIHPLDAAQVDEVLGSFLESRAGAARALVVDDDMACRRLLSRQLESFGLIVEIAVNGREALTQLNEAFATLNPFQLVCLDQHMPGGADGVTVLRGLRMLQRRRGVSAKSTRVLMTTSITDRSVIVAAAAQKVDGYLIKPVNRQKLQAHIEKFGFGTRVSAAHRSQH